MNILLAEPNAAFREELYKVFRKRGWRVTSSHEPSAIVALLQDGKFDALVANARLLPADKSVIPPKLIVISDGPMAEFPFVLQLSSDPFKSAKEAAVFLAKK